MKFRVGFVSNSSSSSFVIGIKNGELSEQSILEAMKVPEHSPLFRVAKSFAEFINKASKPINEAKFLENYCFNSLDEAIESGYITARLIKDEFNVYTLRASYNEGDNPVELMIGNNGLKIETENFIFKEEY